MSRETDEKTSPPVTPDGRYLVVRGRLWRRTNPGLEEAERERLVAELMTGRREVRAVLKSGRGLARARRKVDAATRGLGERGPVWWTDGAPDFNRRMVKNTPYAEWYEGLGEE